MLFLFIFAVACVFVAAVCQSATGFGFALVLVPVLSLAIDIKLAVAASVLLGPVSAIGNLVELWPHMRRRMVAALVVGSIAGVPAGAALLVAATATQLRVLVAVVILFSTLATALGLRLPEPRRPLIVSLLVGAVSGVLRSATSMGGPPVALYLLGLRYESRTFVATSAGYFLFGSIFSVGALAAAGQITTDLLLLVAVCIPALIGGNSIGRRLRARISERGFRLLVVGLLLLTSLVTLLPVVAGAL